MIKAVRIPADESQPLREFTFREGDIKAIQRAVGGTFDAVNGASQGITFWIADEGKLQGLPVNRRATAWLWSADNRFFHQDLIVGDVLVTGLPDDRGDTQSIPDDVLKLLFATDKYKAEFLAAGETSYATNQVEFDDWWTALTYAVRLAGRWKLVRSFRVVPA